MIDVEQQVNAVQRRVGSRVLAAGEARVVTVRQTYRAEATDVWDACTDAERIGRWFLPVSGDLRLGGRYALTGNAEGTIERCDPPRGFDATWEYCGSVSWIEVRIVPEATDRTRLELDHISHLDDELWNRYGPGMVGIGWDMGLMGLALHLPDPTASVDRDEAAAWFAGPDGHRFVGLCSERWSRASVAAGTDPDAARAAATRVTAAYTEDPAASTGA